MRSVLPTARPPRPARALIAVLLTAFLLPLAARPATQPAATLAGGRWFKGNTHTHTVNSDGDSTPDEVVRWYREHGYQFLVLTDHNYLTPTTGLNAVHGAPDKFIVIPGEEVTMTVAAQAGARQRRRRRRAWSTPPTGTDVVDAIQRSVDGIRRHGRRAARQSPELRLGGHASPTWRGSSASTCSRSTTAIHR